MPENYLRFSLSLRIRVYYVGEGIGFDTMINTVRALLTLARPRLWLKNIALFAPIFFSGDLFDMTLFVRTFIGFVSFSLLSSAHYVVNDIVDRESDRNNILKKHRPLPSGAITVSEAIFLWSVLTVSGFCVSFSLGNAFFSVSLIYAGIHYLHILYFRTIEFVDILLLAFGYVLRVYAGQAVSQVAISSWLALTAVSASLLLAIGKRRHEHSLTKYTKWKKPDTLGSSSEGGAYADKLLDSFMAMFATATVFSYMYFSFLTSSFDKGILFADTVRIPEYLDRKWLMATIPLVIYGVMRYLQVLYEEKMGVFEKIITTDKPLLLTGALWVAASFFVIYGIGG